MSLKRALRDLFRAVEEEAARNPAFAEKLEAALAQHKPRRKAAARPAPAAPEPVAPRPPAPPPADLSAINPVSLFNREGEEALRAALEAELFSREALAALVAEHNLDPAGAMGDADKPALIGQIVAQAKARAERDRKLFDY